MVTELHISMPSIYDKNEMENELIYQTSRDPKTLQLEKTEDGRYRLVISVKKLGAYTAVEYFLDGNEAEQLSQALTK
jgi:hypothetical protein